MKVCEFKKKKKKLSVRGTLELCWEEKLVLVIFTL